MFLMLGAAFCRESASAWPEARMPTTSSGCAIAETSSVKSALASWSSTTLTVALAAV